MKVLITGATGLIGQEIVSLCHDRNISVNYLTTSKNKIETKDNYQGYYWSPKNGEIDASCLNDVDAIINLVGASIAKRWTSTYKKEVIDSRVKTAELLFQTLKNNDHNVKQIISASAIGVYADSQTNYYEENSQEFGSGFLTKVVTMWETAVNKFEAIGLKVSKIRIGLVLADKGGALPEIIKPIKFGAGSAFGKGEQWQSWIHVSDLANIFLFTLEKGIGGIINGVAPNPVTNAELTKAAATILERPLIVPNIPKFVMKLALGEMHTILFESQRVSSKKIENLGFSFKYHHLEPALKDLLK
jgi:uncharacterized protein (TIGR01777 family)